MIELCSLWKDDNHAFRKEEPVLKQQRISGEQILSAAKKIAREEGLQQVNIRNVARESGISVGSVYNYYETKWELVFDVVQDYWQSVLKEVSLSGLPRENFCTFFAAFYHLLWENFLEFITGWVSVMSSFHEEEKHLGRQKEAEIFDEVKALLTQVLAEDKNIDPRLWEETFRLEEMVEFILSNLLNLLKQRQRDCDFFVEVLRRLLYDSVPRTAEKRGLVDEA